MRWNDKRFYGVATLALIVGASGLADARKRDERAGRAPYEDASVPRDDAITTGDPYTIAGQKFEPRDDNTFDETGYASISDEADGAQTSNGEYYRPGAVSASHRILPVPSYVEITHLETGKTILVRINDRGPMVLNRVTEVSLGAARLLGLSGSGSFPVRVRRVNPPFPERTVLRLGNAAPDRLDTPPALLSALKRRLVESGQPKPKDVVMTPPAPRPAPPKADARPRPAPMPAPAPRAGAEFDDAPPPVAAPIRRGNDRFVVEGDGIRAAPRPRPAPVAAAPATYFVQIASFGSEARARALADRAGGKVANVGTVWRVLTGPYSNEAAARSALSQAVAKGYRDARISR